SRGGEAEDAVLIGLDPDGPGAPRTLTEGRVAVANGEAVFSASGFSEVWQVGDVAELDDSGLEVEVVGVARDAAANASPTLYVPLTTYEELVRTRIGTAAPLPVSFVAVHVDDGGDPATVAAAIESSVDGLA